MREFFMKTMKMLALAAVLFGATTAANAATAFLATDDFVGISFWLISMGMLAATAFFFMEQANVSSQWRKSVNVAGLVTGIAFIHYMYMRAVWIETGDTPTVYRYIDWLITVPLQLVEFYLILSAVRKVDNLVYYFFLVQKPYLTYLLHHLLSLAAYQTNHHLYTRDMSHKPFLLHSQRQFLGYHFVQRPPLL